MIEVSEEVEHALAAGRGVVALESSIVAQGLPAPMNVHVAREMEQAVRDAGAVPAMIAIVRGAIRVGLDDEALEALTGDGVRKAAAADLAPALAFGHTAGTTVSATTWVADRLGIRVFATGGIGGVHRGNTGDVSSDLSEMARRPVCVVAAGAKMVLDLPRTLERLETLGVLAVGYQTDDFPAFYCRASGVSLAHRVDDAEAVVQLLRARWDQLAQGGVLLCNPCPSEAAISTDLCMRAVEAACVQAEDEGVRGKALTPFLLAALSRVEGLNTVECNRALAVSNASLAGRVAVAWSS